MPCREYIDLLSTKDPVPGGGGACAIIGAIGTALGNMVGSLTVGKRKYADVEAQMIDLMAKGEELRRELTALCERDAQVFAPLAEAYSLPKETGDQKAYKEQVMENALRGACDVPLEIMEKCSEALQLMAVFAEKGSVMAVSDAGVGALCCKAALQGAALNVLINTKAMKDRAYADEINQKADVILEEYAAEADKIYQTVLRRLLG